MQKIHDEVNTKILNKDRIGNSTLPNHMGALDKKKNH